MRNVLFQANWAPQYRAPFYDGLRAELALRDVRLVLTYGDPPKKFRDRGDHEPLPWAVRRWQWMPGTDRIGLQFDPVHLGKQYDLVILEVIAKQVTTYLQLLLASVGLGPRVAFFGHGAVDRTPSTRLARRVKRALATAGEGWLVYTEAGRRELVTYGVRADSVHVLNNTIDASGLRDACEASKRRTAGIRRSLGLGGGPVLLHIGGLDPSKRLDVVLESFTLVQRHIPDVELVVAGTGSSAPDVVEAARQNQRIHYLGPVFGDDRSELFAVSSLLIHPGKVGLVVIDSFATGVPLVVGRGQLQAPEYDYLHDGLAAFVAAPDSELVARTVIDLLRDPERLSAMSAQAISEHAKYDMSSMVQRAADGIETLLGETP